MKKLILILLLLIPLKAQAETALVKVPTQLQRNYGCYPFLINFPGFICKMHYCSSQRYPLYLKGDACGIYVVCRKLNSNHYFCRY